MAPGDILVADPDAGPGAKGAILKVDRATGAQSVVSSGGQFEDPVGVAIANPDELFVADADAFGGSGAVFAVDPGTGAQRVVTRGALLREPTGIAVSSFRIVIADPAAGELISVDPETGAQTPGPVPDLKPLVDPSGVSVTGGLVFTDASSGDGGLGAVYSQFSPVRGALLTEPFASEGNLVDPFGIAWAPTGLGADSPVVADPNAAGGGGALIGLSGASQRVLSSGRSFSDPTGVAVRSGPPSELVVVDRTASGTGAVLAVDPRTGAQTPVSTGGSFARPTGIAVAAPQCKGVTATKPGSDAADEIGGGGVVAALGGDDRVTGDDTDDLVCGDDGDDRIESEVGIALTYGDDKYLGGEGDDDLRGGSGGARDTLVGGPGDDKASGRGGRDRLRGGGGADVLRGGNGRDSLNGGGGRDVCIGNKGKDRAVNCERKRGI